LLNLFLLVLLILIIRKWLTIKGITTAKKPFIYVRWSRVHSKTALVRTLEDHFAFVTSVAITSDNSKIVSGSSDHTVRGWDLHLGKCYLNNRFDAAISSIALFGSGNSIVLGDVDGNLYAGTLYS
jgi:WD40 repeat protein